MHFASTEPLPTLPTLVTDPDPPGGARNPQHSACLGWGRGAGMLCAPRGSQGPEMRTLPSSLAEEAAGPGSWVAPSWLTAGPAAPSCASCLRLLRSACGGWTHAPPVVPGGPARVFRVRQRVRHVSPLRLALGAAAAAVQESQPGDLAALTLALGTKAQGEAGTAKLRDSSPGQNLRKEADHCPDT